MRNKELFDKSISILMNAYINDKLEPYSECGCAVGNLIAGNMGYTLVNKEIRYIRDIGIIEYKWCDSYGVLITPEWGDVHCAGFIFDKTKFIGNAKNEIESTGYEPEQTCKIENAFMLIDSSGLSPILSEDKLIYKRLMAVVDVLMDIHEASEEEIIDTKNLFVKA